MIDYDKYDYNEHCVFGKQEKKDRLESQLGSFGEQLVMTLLGRIAKYSVAYVDHEGADLIATDIYSKLKYAISVKTCQFGPDESETKVFEKKDQEKLKLFARDFELIPTVAMVIIPKDFAFIDVYIIALDDFERLAQLNSTEIEEGAIKYTKENGLQINNYSLEKGKKQKYSDKKGHLKYLQNNELIEHIRLDVHNREKFRKGIRKTTKETCNSNNDRDKRKDYNLPRQLGTAGEYLLMMLLGQQKHYKVARVDHVGADLIARDTEGNKYAISVKTRQDNSYTFKELYYTAIGKKKKPRHELGKLQDFAEKYDMIPVIACIFVKSDFKGMDIYISSLANWIKISKFGRGSKVEFGIVPGIENYPNINDIKLRWRETMWTFKISCRDKEYLNNIEGVEHMEIDFLSALVPEKKWN